MDVAVEAVGGTGIGIKQAVAMVRHNGIVALYGDSYAPVPEFCFHRFHEDGLEIRNLNGVHYTKLQSVENMREAYRAVERGVFNLDMIFENSVRYPLDDIANVFAGEAACPGYAGLAEDADYSSIARRTMDKTTFALFFGNRGFFPASLLAEAREELPRVLKGMGHEVLMLGCGCHAPRRGGDAAARARSTPTSCGRTAASSAASSSGCRTSAMRPAPSRR